MCRQPDRRDHLLRIAAGQTGSYVPAAFFLHFESGYHQGVAAIAKNKEFFEFTGMDFVKVQFELPWPKVEVLSPKSWANLPYLKRDFYAPQLEVLGGLIAELGSRALVVLTLYSPFMIACEMGGADTLTRHLSEDPATAKRGIEIAAESLAGFVDDCIGLGIDGFYHSTQGAEVNRFSDPEIFTQAIKPFDLAIMGEINRRCHFNILHICDYHRSSVGGYASPEPFLDYPGHIVNCSTHFTNGVLTPAQIAAQFNRPFMGGMRRLADFSGTEEQTRAAAREVLASAPSPFILAADCTVPATTPWANVRAAVEEAHLWPVAP